MKNKKVIIIAMNEPLDTDAHLRQTMKNAENRAARQSSRFPELDLLAIQKQVHKNLLDLQFRMNGTYMGLLDLINYARNNRKPVQITPENIGQFYTLSKMITLNGIYLYQYLVDHGYEPLLIQNYSLVNLSEFLDERPLAICISSTFMYLDDIRKIATRIKAYDHQIPVIAGGILVKKVLDAGANLAAETLNWLSSFHNKVDTFIVEAQGEQTLVRLLDALRDGETWEGIENLIYFDPTERMIFTSRTQEDTPIDRTAIRWAEIPHVYLGKSLPVNTSRGCFYRCRFCSYHRLFPKVHYKSIVVLRDELRQIERLGFVSHVRFTDDNFTANVDRLRSVLNMIIEEGFGFTWSSYARASSLTPELVKLLKASRCQFLNMGIESGSQTILNHMDKRLKRDQAIDAIRTLNDHGIYSEGGFIVGYPGETLETFHETVDLIQTSSLPYYQPFLFYYSKDMGVHGQKDRFRLEGLGRAWRHATMDATEASRLMGRMNEMIDGGFSNGLMGNWETFKLLLVEGHHTDEIFQLFRLKRDLQLALKKSSASDSFSPDVERILRQFEEMVINASIDQLQ